MKMGHRLLTLPWQEECVAIPAQGTAIGLLEEVGNDIPPAQFGILDQSAGYEESGRDVQLLQNWQRQIVVIPVPIVERDHRTVSIDAPRSENCRRQLVLGEDRHPLLEPQQLFPELSRSRSYDTVIEVPLIAK